jgi:AraC family transcriptional regulator
VEGSVSTGRPRNLDDRPSQTIDHRVSTAAEMLKNDLGRTISLDDIAKRVSVSRSGLRLLFKRDLGVSPGRFLKEARLDAARLLLCTKNHSIKETMVLVGLNDSSHFVRDFERRFGLSPARYRRRYFELARSAE